MRRFPHLVILAIAAFSAHCGSCTENLPSFTPGPGFDVREATIDSIHEALYKRQANCRDVVSAFIARIEEMNPQFHAVLSLNPHALEDADRLDSGNRFSQEPRKLHCIPILLKDNYDATGMPTTAGCRALAHLEPATDGPVVAALKAEGAIILGKANMHEMALEGLSVSSLGGQTLNPYDLGRTPGGSSGGSGAALAANLAVIATGTDTVNSLRSPASANNLFSFRPTRGLISRAGVVPVSYTQDALGAMARSVRDLTTVLEVMAGAGHDPSDNATSLRPSHIDGTDYDAALFGGSLKGKRFGVLSGFHNRSHSNETTPVIKAMSSMERVLTSSGAKLVNITTPIFDITTMLSQVDVQTFEYREMLNEYLQREHLNGEPRPRSFEELYRGEDFLVIPHQYEHVISAHNRSTSDTRYHTKQGLIKELRAALHKEFQDHSLDAIIYPEQRNLVVKVGSHSQIGRNGILAAVTGSPVVAVPAGWSEPSKEAPCGVPIGMEILGLPWTEGKLLNIAQLLSQETGSLRKVPKLSEHVIPTKSYADVPFIKHDRGEPLVYPMGALA